MSKQPLEYGSWPSELSATQLAEGSVRYGHIQVDNGCFFWLESLPQEAGRQVIKCYSPDGQLRQVIPEPYSVRSRVHEYGGGDFCVQNRKIVFSNDADQRLYQQIDDRVVALTAEPQFKHAVRYADMQIHPDGSYLVAVRETHPVDHDPKNVCNELVFIDLQSGTETVVVSGEDFYAYPRFSPTGDQLTWLSWQHPNMPWDSTKLSLGKVSGRKVLEVKELMDDETESVYQPSWCPDGELHFVSDRSNWWNIYSLRDGILNALTPMAVEFGFPQWQFGIRSYQFINDNQIAAIFTHNGIEQLCLVELDAGHIIPLELNFCYYERGVQYDNGCLFFIGASPDSEPAAYKYCLENHKLERISESSESKVKIVVSKAETIEFPVAGQTAHAFYYAPESEHYTGPKDTKPPLVVMIHGGPTGATHAAYNSGIQYWTSRGFAVVDVNYRGSTGYGRAYRSALRQQWGIADTEDCIAVVAYLADTDRINPERVAIRGGSAGGYTVYRALQESEAFKAGVSRYGVADLTSLTRETHKFELRYLDSLIGAWPEDATVYEERSPINNAEKLTSPTLILQGDEDAVVPPSQSLVMAEALDSREIPFHIEILAGEQHGFRQSKNIILALELELNFYRQVFDIKAKEQLASLELKHAANLSK